MDKIILGKTGLEVSVLGLGSGGHSKLGKNQGKSDDNAAQVIKKAVELGVNLIDSSEVYGTESIIGSTIRDIGTDNLVISTKLAHKNQEKFKTPEEIENSLDQSLENLKIDAVDIYHVHAATIQDYPAVAEKIYPVLNRLKEKGKIKFIGITEGFSTDTDHRMITRAVQDDYWDVIMLGFNILNPCARDFILKTTQQKQIGVLCMHTVRQALINQQNLKIALQKHIKDEKIDASKINLDDPLGFLLQEEGNDSIAAAAYRFARYEPGIHSVLSGTGSVEHLETNIKNIHKGPLSSNALEKLKIIFGDLDCLNSEI